MPEKDILREEMQKSSLALIEQAHELSGLVSEALKKHGSTGEVVAGLRMIEALGRSIRVILEGSGSTIFPNGSNQETAPAAAPVNEATVAEVVKPTTFAQLLKLRVAELFDPQVPTVSRGQIGEAIGERGLRRAFEATNIPFTHIANRMFVREMAMALVYAGLTIQDPHLKLRHSFGRSSLMASFLRPYKLKPESLSRWSEEIEYDWDRNPTVNMEEAMGVRGLAILESRTVKP